MPRATEVVWRPVAALVGEESGVLGLNDHTLEQVVEFVGCLGVKFVIVFLQGGQGTGWDWRLGMDTRSCTGAL